METNCKTIEEKYMVRCIQLAKQGICGASPNPMVGAVVVCDDKIIGEGYHRMCGGPHAEVNAITSVKDTSKFCRSTIYVSLEPCSHYGKTPPCTELIIKSGIPKVVIGCIDPFAKVAGRGVKKLRQAGVEVVVGVMEQECQELNKQFMTFHSMKRPYIILKWAESADGFMDVNRSEGKPVILSNPLSSMLVHKKRAEVDAIMVGTRTAILDNPQLNVRNWYGKHPLRIFIDRTLKVPSNSRLLDNSVKTWVITEVEHADDRLTHYEKIDFSADVLSQLMTSLHRSNIQSVLVEGGSQLLQSFIDTDLWDEIYVEKADVLLTNGVKSPSLFQGIPHVDIHFNTFIYHYLNNKREFYRPQCIY